MKVHFVNKYFIILSFFILFGISCATGRPSIKFTQTMYDFGSAKASEIIEHEFEFENTGSGVLKIEDLFLS